LFWTSYTTPYCNTLYLVPVLVVCYTTPYCNTLYLVPVPSYAKSRLQSDVTPDSRLQALDFFRPHKTTEPLERLYELVRSVVPPLEKDRHFEPDIRAVSELIRNQDVVRAVMPAYRSGLHRSE